MFRRATRLFGGARYLWDAVREINPGEVRADLERPFLVALFGSEGSGRRTLSRALFGVEPSDRSARELALAGVEPGAVGALGRPDLAILVVDASRPDWSAERRTAQELAARGSPLFLVLTHADLLPVPDQAGRAAASQFPDHPPELTVTVDPRDGLTARLRLVGPILQTVPHLRLALAHRFPPLRRVVAEDLVRETSRANAQFALMSSLPAMVPVLGTFVGNMADLLVLTKNQALLVFKLAGIYGRDVDDRLAVLREIAPVIGGGFLWRSMARTAVGLFPPLVSALPKTAVAYIGTYVVGEAARYYYERGHKPPSETLRLFREQAARRYQEVNGLLKRRRADDVDPRPDVPRPEPGDVRA
jgi:uncharacterized protein (DUF697 family)